MSGEEQPRTSSRARQGLTLLGSVVVVLYAIGVTVTAPYYNWKYAQQHGFVPWLLLGEVIATAKSVAWPYFVVRGREHYSLEAPPSVRAWAESMSVMYDADSITQNMPRSPDPSTDMQSVLTLLHEASRQVDSIRPQDLDALVPGWGTTYKATTGKAISLLLSGLESVDQTKVARGDAQLVRWNEWWDTHRLRVLNALQSKLHLEVRRGEAVRAH